MNRKDFNIKIVCFGEILWDVIGDKYLPGGAPLNVAYHLKKLGIESRIISKVGTDELGERLVNVINNWNIDSSDCQLDLKYPTGEVYPIIGLDHDAEYNIKFPVAWDFIEFEDSLHELIADANAFVFGSLITRNETSRKTLLKLLKISKYNVFDVNLRGTNHNQEIILKLLTHTQLLKVNKDELDIILSWLNYEGLTEVDKVRYLQDTFKIDEILITKGAKGAVYHVSGKVFHSPVYTVKLKDTVGSGDAFLASFISGKFYESDIEQNLKRASALGAFVASSVGACPDYNVEELEEFINSSISLDNNYREIEVNNIKIPSMSNPIKLNAANLFILPEAIKIPRYKREEVQTGIVHIGIGGFHRAHQAYFMNNLLEKGLAKNWGICGIALLKADRKIHEVLSEQDGLYTLIVPDANGNFTAEVIGSIIELLYAPENPLVAIQKMADPMIKIITLTITESGYNFTSDGSFNWDNHAILWDIEHPDKPKTVFGYLYHALKIRSKLGRAGLTIQSCDNMEHNGDITRKMLYTFITKVDPELIEWLDEHVAFPNSMVDRITPVTSENLKTGLTNDFGLLDSWPVACESFCQWIIEDSFIAGRPKWEKVGAQLVSDVTPYEKMKIRLLNGGHTLVGFAGYLSGYRYIHESVSDPLILGYLKQYMDEEVCPTLDVVPGIDLVEYKNTIVQRFQNQFIMDEVARIISSSSAKFPKFILPTILDRLEDQKPVNAAAFIVSTWYIYLKLKIPDPSAVQDDFAEVMLKSVEDAELKNDPLLFLNHSEIFDDLKTYSLFTDSFLSHIRALRGQGICNRIQTSFKYDKPYNKTKK